MRKNGSKKMMKTMVWIAAAAVLVLAVVCAAAFLPQVLNGRDEPIPTQEMAVPVTEETAAETEAASVPEETAEETEAPAPTEEETQPAPVSTKAVLEMKISNVIGPENYPRPSFTAITFVNSTDGASADAWDISADQNGTILAWTVPDSENAEMRQLFIGSSEHMYAADGLSFEYFDRVKKIDFAGLLDTSEMTSLAAAFRYVGYQSGSDLELDLSSWNVSGVTNLTAMFFGCSTLTSVNLDGWNIANVKLLDDMFLGCKSLKQLDITEWQLAEDCSRVRTITDCPALSNAAELAAALGFRADLTQKDFPQERLSDLTIPEMELAVGNSGIVFPKRKEWKMEYAGEINGMPVYNQGEGWAADLKGDLGERYDAYNELDLDHDGKRDWIEEVASDTEGIDNFVLHFGGGQDLPLEVTNNYALGCCSCAFFFGDINGSGKDDILAVKVHQYMGSGGREITFALFTDAKGSNRYFRQTLPPMKFTLQGLQDDYVRVSCPSLGYYEAFHIGGTPKSNDAGKTTIEHYFGSRASEKFRVQSVRMEGDKLIILFNFHSAMYGHMTENPFGAELTLAPGGYFNVTGIGSEVVRNYWLNS